MSPSNSPDPALRQAAVQQDLENVLHPIVQHKVLESKQMVVTGGEGSTIFDADGSAFLDAMAGLWCVNIGYGRTELAEVAAEQMRQLSYFPHTAMNVPAAKLAEKINRLMGTGYHTYFVNSGSEANEAGFKIARQYMKHEYPGEYRFKTISRYFAYHGTTLATLDAGGGNASLTAAGASEDSGNLTVSMAGFPFSAHALSSTGTTSSICVLPPTTATLRPHRSSECSVVGFPFFVIRWVPVVR